MTKKKKNIIVLKEYGAEDFKKILARFEDLIDDITLDFKKDGIEIKQGDRSLVSYVISKIGKETFDRYEVPEEREVSFALADFLNVLRKFRYTDVKIEITDESIKIESGKKMFRLPLLETNPYRLEDDELKNLEFKTQKKIDGSEFKTVIAEASLIGDAIDIVANKRGFIFRTNGNGVGQYQAEIDVDSRDKKNRNLDGELKGDYEVRSRFPLDFLKKMVKSRDNYLIRLGNDIPMEMEIENKKEKTKFLLAPRIIQEE